MEAERLIFSGMQLLVNQQWLSGHALVVENKKISNIILAKDIPSFLPARHYEFADTDYLSPGFIDLHIHGAKGSDVMDASEHALSTISQALAEEGVTSFLATTMSASDADIEAVLSLMPAVSSKLPGANLLGVHLEGPFLAVEKAGAQAAKHLQAPNIDKIKRWQQLSDNAIKLVTFAPELAGASDFAKALSKMNIIASLGHSDASYDQANQAIFDGCHQVTHLFNAMRHLHHREPGMVTAALLADAVKTELIADGLHLHPAILQLVYQLKGKDSIILVTDAMRAKCLGDGCYDLGGQSVEVKAGRAALENGSLAGSTLTMPQAVKNMAAFSGCSLAEAIAMASAVPARQLGIADQKGSIDIGMDADLVVLNQAFEVLMTVKEGIILKACAGQSV